MVERRLRSRSFRRIPRKLPGGRVKIQYKKRNPQPHQCGQCGAVLKGIPRAVPLRMKNMAKTMKRPQRPYGGVLCTKCQRSKILDSIHK
jgi:large subunit ribosomal protein L34e